MDNIEVLRASLQRLRTRLDDAISLRDHLSSIEASIVKVKSSPVMSKCSRELKAELQSLLDSTVSLYDMSVSELHECENDVLDVERKLEAALLLCSRDNVPLEDSESIKDELRSRKLGVL